MKGGISKRIKERAADRSRPDGSGYRSLSFADQALLAREQACSQRQVQICALEQGIVPEVYARNQKRISNNEQLRLLKTRVAVIGLGGLGGTVTEILSRVGIGMLVLVDGDRFEDSNLNRQLLSSTEALGKKKAEVAAARVAAVNPAVEVRAVPAFLTGENAEEILAGADMAVDCLDDIATRFMLERACRAKNIPLVAAAVGGTAGQVTVIYPDDPGLALIYGDPATVRPKGVEQSMGTLAYAATAMAAIECAEVVALAAGNPARLRRRLLLYDLADQAMEQVVLDAP